MSFILNIDTSATQACVSLSKDGEVLSILKNHDQKEHASFLQPGVKKILEDQHISLSELAAIAVVNGPGSYTGLRVALASAKGLCYIAKKPLITIGSLPLMAKSALPFPGISQGLVTRLCPMIDARRMEVFTAVYDLLLDEILPARAMVLSNDSFVDILLQETVLFFGNGAAKWATMITDTNALFAGSFDTTTALAQLAYDKFKGGEFADLAYCEPFYLKEFYTGG
jgi:tRNA threonylcarbamoyladenosine biosynthesis protein TsaB